MHNNSESTINSCSTTCAKDSMHTDSTINTCSTIVASSQSGNTNSISVLLCGGADLSGAAAKCNIKLVEQLGRRKLMSRDFNAETIASKADALWLAPRNYWTYTTRERNIQDPALELANAFRSQGKHLVIMVQKGFTFKNNTPPAGLNRAETSNYIVYASFGLERLSGLVGVEHAQQLTNAVAGCLVEGYLGVGQSNSETYFQKGKQENQQHETTKTDGAIKPKKAQKQTDGTNERASSRNKKSATSKSSKAKVTFDDDDGAELGDHATNNDVKPNYAKEYAKQNKLKQKPRVEKGTDDCGEEISAIEIDDTTAFAAFSSDILNLGSDINYETENYTANPKQIYFSTVDELTIFMQNETNVKHSAGIINISTVGSFVMTEKEKHIETFVAGLGEPFCSHEWKTSKSQSMHVMEVFGGHAGVTRLAIKYQMNAGRCFDLNVGIDLTRPDEQKKLLAYVRLHKPRCIVGGPPCTAFGPWARFNRVHNYEAWHRSYVVGRPLARLMAELCWLQHQSGRFFLVENPWASDLWQLPEWQELLPYCYTAYCEQCTFGLQDMDGSPTLKPTAFVSNDLRMIEGLNVSCGGRHTYHAPLAGNLHGVSKTKHAQRWPDKLCQAIIKNVAKVCFSHVQYMNTRSAKHYTCSLTPEQFYAGDEQPVICPGCKSHAYRRDPRHNRIPGVCKFPDESSDVLTCEACKRNLPSHHPKHSKKSGECHWADATPRLTGGSSSSRGPRPAVNVVPDRPLSAPPASAPAPCSLGHWYRVDDEYTINILNALCALDGWHDMTDGAKALVTTQSRYTREPQPRFENSSLPLRSTFGRFLEHAHENGTWWQLEESVEYAGKDRNLGYPIECLIHVFYPSASDSSTENITRSDPYQTPLDESPPEELSEPQPLVRRKAVKPITEQELLKEIEYGEEETEVPEISTEQQASVPAKQQAEDKIEKAEEIDWSAIDLGTALRELRSEDTTLATRALRKLHLRWYHAPATRMKLILSRVGIPEKILTLVTDVCDTCRICRAWKRPVSKAMSHLTQAEGFNDRVQLDLLFVGDSIILHVCDECTRFSVAELIRNREPEEILRTLKKCWIKYFGVPKLFISDSEGALGSEEAAIWAERLNTSFKLLPRGSHATVVERHHETLRQLIHKIAAQCKIEKLTLNMEDVVSEATVAKNSLLVINGVSPFQAVLGRNPNLLGEYEQPTVSSLADDVGGQSSKHAMRLREIAVASMIEHSAKERIKRAQTSQTRVASEQLELKANDLVDIFRTPRTKDNVGWRGPCRVVNVEDGTVNVQWNGRIISCRVQDVRRALMYPTILQDRNEDTAFEVVRQHAASLKDTSETFCVVSTPTGWQLTRAAQQKPVVFQALVKIAFQVFFMPRCVGGKIGRGSTATKGLLDTEQSVLVWWPVNQPQLYKSMLCSGELTLNLKELFGESYQDTAWIRMFGVDSDNVEPVRQVVDDLPHLAENPPGDIAAVPFDIDDQSMTTERDDMSTSIMSRSTRLATPMDTETGQPPPHPPQPPLPQRLKHKQQKNTVPSDRSRSTYMPSPPPSHGPIPIPIHTGNSLSSILTPNSTSPVPSTTGSQQATINTDSTRKVETPRGDKRTTTEQETRAPKQARTTMTTPSSPSATDDPQTQTTQQHEPLLPIADTDDEAETDNETLAEPEIDKTLYTQDAWSDMCFITKPPPLYHTWELAPGIEDLCEHQQHYLQNSQVCQQHLPMRSSKLKDEQCEIEVGPSMAKMFFNVPDLKEDEVLVFKVSQKKEIVTQIEKNYDALTPKEIKDNYKLVEQAVRKELASFVEHKTWTRKLRTLCKNVCSSRWVLRWKEIDGVRSIKARLTIRGFEDTADVTSYASTASRWSQRLVVSLAVQHGWQLWISDISTAFLRGMTFQELSALTQTETRDVAFTPPKGWERYFSELPNMSDFNFATEVLQLLKAVYGLRDAPRAWRIRLDKELRQLGGFSLPTDKSLYCFYDAQQKLEAVISAHVDDLKGTGRPQRVKLIMTGLESAFGKMKIQYDNFTHCGLVHEKLPNGYKIQQDDYAKQLICIDTTALDVSKPETPLNEEFVARFQSLLGGLSWLIQTRMEICVYVTALQRAATKATVGHVIKINKLTKWVRRKHCQLTYTTMTGEIKLLCISDSAFRTEPQSTVALRGAIIGIWATDNTLHVIEYFCRKQRRVCRSTFAAETNALADAVEVTRLINYTLTHLHQNIAPNELSMLEESGKLPVRIECMTDCRSLYETLASADLHTPSEASLILIIAMLRELLQQGVISIISWIDTNDMLADGLTKGLVSRKALLQVSNTGKWQLQKAYKRHEASTSSASFVTMPQKVFNSVLCGLNWSLGGYIAQ